TEPAHLVHPRCYGAVPAFLRMVREKKLMKWEQAVQKLTSEPARLLGMKDRGILAEGSAADVVVLDPRSVTDRATYEYPTRLPEGISDVIVNGRQALSGTSVVGMHGQVIKR